MAPFFVSGPHYRNCPAVGGSISIGSYHAIKDLVLADQVCKRGQHQTTFNLCPVFLAYQRVTESMIFVLVNAIGDRQGLR